MPFIPYTSNYQSNEIKPEWVSVSPNKTILDTSGAEAVEFAISGSISKDINPGDYEGQIAVRTENRPDVIFSYGVDVSKARKGPLIWGPKLAHREMVDTHPKFQRKIVSSNPGMSRIPRNVDASRYAFKSVPRVYKNPTSGRGTRQINTTRDYMIKTKREIPNIPIRSRFDGVGIGVSYSSNDEATRGETLTVNVSVKNGCDSSNMTVEIIPIAVDEWDNYSDSTPFIPCSCTLSFSNEINPEWVSVEPGKVELTPEERANYTISIFIPENANTGCYEGAFLIKTDKEPFLAMPYSYGFSDPEYNREFIPPPPPVTPDWVGVMF